MDDRYYWRIEASYGKIPKTRLWPLFTDTEVRELTDCYGDHTKVYADSVIDKCYEKGLTLASTNGAPDNTVYHLVRNPQPPQLTIIPPQLTIINEIKET